MILRFNIDKSKLKIPSKKLSHILYNKMTPDKRCENNDYQDIKKRVNKLSSEYSHMLMSKGVARNLEPELFTEIFADSITDNSPIFTASKSWAASAVFICTIGSDLDLSIRSLQERGKREDAILLDRYGSLLIEKTADIIQAEWGKLIAKSLDNPEDFYLTRYSPGYCNWKRSGQIALFGFMADADFPVSLIDSEIMYPSKSISGVFAVEKKADSTLISSCALCSKRCENARAINMHIK